MNIQKTKVIIFKNTRAVRDDDHFYLNNESIEIVDTFCYLGIQLNSNGTFDKAMTNSKNKALRALFKINNVVKPNKIHNPSTLLKLFDSMVKPIALYACQVWCQDLLKYDLKDIHKINKILCEGRARALPALYNNVKTCCKTMDSNT